MPNQHATTKSSQKSADPLSRTPQHQPFAGVNTPLSGEQIGRAVANPRQLLPSDVLMLQRTVGNRATTQLLQSHVNTRVTPPAAPPIQRAMPVGTEGGAVDAKLESSLQQAQPGGSALPNRVRRALEPSLGADLGAVRVHTDRQAVQLSRDLGAKAFTHKNHIYYGQGQSPTNLKLTAHEAVHTIQQGSVSQATAQRTPRRKNAKAEDTPSAEIGQSPQVSNSERIAKLPAPISTLHSHAQRVQRLTQSEEASLTTKMGRPKFQKAKSAGKLDFFFAKSDSELSTIRAMSHNDFDSLLLTASTTSTTPSTTTSGTTPTTGTSGTTTTPPSPQGKLAWLFEKVQNGAIAFINSAKYAFSSDTLLSKLVTGLTGKMTGEISSEQLKLEVAGMQIPFGSLAATEFDMKLAAKLAEQGPSPTTFGEKVSGLGGKVMEGLDTEGLIDTSLGLKPESETGPSLSTTKLMKEMSAPQKNLKLFHRSSPTTSSGGTPSPGVEFSGEGSVAAKVKLLFGWLHELANKYIGEPLRALELKVKEDLLSATNEESAQQSTLGWLVSSTGSTLSSLGSMVMSGLRSTDQYLGGYGSSVMSKAWDWSTWAASYVPEWVRAWMPSFDKEGLKKWFEDRTKFIEKLDPNNAMPKLGGAIETKGAYVAPFQVEDMDTNVSLDLNIPESYLATWAKEIQDQFLPDSSLAQLFSAGVGGKLSLFRLQGYSFSRAKGFRGLIPSLRMGPGFAMLWKLISNTAKFARKAASKLFHAVFGP